MALEAIVNSAASYNITEPAAKPQKAAEKPEVHSEPAVHTTANIGSVPEIPAGEKAGGKSTEDLREGEKKEGQPMEKKVKDALSQVNNKIKNTRTGCEFTYHEETNRVSIKVIDKDTKEVIREIPPEKSIKMIEKLWELAGILVDEKL